MAYDFLLSSNTLPSGRTAHYASIAGSENSKFTIGYRTKYLDNFGLFNISVDKNQVYEPSGFLPASGFWAYFIYPTAMAESKGSYNCLNTYDRAKFTFSFMQYAAHVPNGDFVLFFRKLLALPLAAEYFPKLVLQNNRIFYKNQNGSLHQLEDDHSSQALMDYLNPSLSEIETQELICSARMVHWAKNDPEHRRVQVETAIQHFRKNMVAYDKRFGLNNVPAKVCQVICDIRHQGRATNDRIAAAMNTAGNWDKAFNNLLSIGEVNYGERIKTVRSNINSLLSQGLFDKVYDSSKNDFI